LLKIMSYIQLLRVHHYIKNIIIFIPLFFTMQIINVPLLRNAGLGFLIFSLLASIIYIFNDLRDIEKDRQHNSKCRRPLASGEIPVLHAILIMIILAVLLITLIVLLIILIDNLLIIFSLLLLYFSLNIGYSLGLKNFPIVDITILTSGYIIRLLFGAVLVGSNVSVWLYLVIIMGAYYLVLGKRKNEIASNENGTREVINFYNHDFLDKNMYVCQALCIIFYALWSFDSETIERFQTSAFIYTIPLIFLIFLKYSLNIEKIAEGDPVSVLLKDRILLLLVGIYVICAFCIIYFNRIVL